MKLCHECQHCYEDTDTVCTEDNAALTTARVGSRLLAGKYRLEQLLGNGDIGTAYAATDTHSERHVIAVELIRDEVLSDPQALERFHEAAKAAGRNNDQEVGQVSEHGALAGGGAYVVMELLDGDNEQEKEETPSTNISSDTPTVEVKSPSSSTGALDARRARAPKLAGIAKELTQEVPRLPLSLPPREPPAAATDAPLSKTAGDNEQVSGSITQIITSSRPTSGEIREQPPAHITDIQRTSTPRRRPLFLYLGLALLLALVLAALWYGLRRAPDASPGRDAAQTGTAKQNTAQSQQATTPATGQSASSTSEASGSAPARTDKEGAATNSSEGGAQAEEPRAAVSAVLDDWLSAFVKQDAEKFMGFYMPELDAFYDKRNIRLLALRSDIVSFFERTQRVEARMIGEPRINFTEGERAANVRFRLSYSIEGRGRDRKRGDGTQELQLVKTNWGWKIKSHRGEKLMG
jgi:hypothetical protein